MMVKTIQQRKIANALTSCLSLQVKTAMPGLLSSVSYGQSDLWAAGTLIYEIYGLDNPFSLPAAAATASPRRRPKQLDSATYKESQLPRLPRSAPPWVRHLVADILRRNPRAVSVPIFYPDFLYFKPPNH